MCGRGGALSPRVGHMHGRLHSRAAVLPSPGAFKEPVFWIRMDPRSLMLLGLDANPIQIKRLASEIENKVKILYFVELDENYEELWVSPGDLESIMFYVDLGINMKHLLPSKNNSFFYSILGSDSLNEMQNRNITGISC